jgi:phage baseplate assembly protein W
VPDLSQNYGSDLVVSANGDLLTCASVQESEQRVLRRLFTNPGDYIWQPTYGAGLPQKIGSPFDVSTIETIVQSQMYLEDSVVRVPPPEVDVAAIPNGMFVDIEYTEADTQEDVVLSFPVSPVNTNG